MSAAGSARSGPPTGPVQQGLKEALMETLTAILSPVQEVRAAAEEQIKVLEVTEGEWRAAAWVLTLYLTRLTAASWPAVSLINQPGPLRGRAPCGKLWPVVLTLGLFLARCTSS